MAESLPGGSPEPLDPIRLEVVRGALAAIGDEMALGLQRAAYSTNIKTRLDFSCAIFDRSVRLIAQSFTQPVHLGSLAYFVPRIVGEYGVERLRPGDGLLSNDGHGGGIHLNDVCLVSPVFHGERLIAFVAAMAHHVDVGGGTPGSIGLFQEIFQEGVIIPPTLFVKDGQVDENVFRLILKNVRSPRETGGDVRAQVAGVNIGMRRLREMIERYSLPGFFQAVEQLLDYTERRVRADLARIPRGVYQAEGYLDDDGFTDEPITVVVKITVQDGRVIYDLTGSDPQRPCPVNTTFAMTFSSCAYSLRALMDPDLPMNDGFYRVLEVIAPPGTIVHSRPPAAIGAGSETGQRVCETAFLALYQAVPERVTAGSKGAMCNTGFGALSPRTGDYFVFYEAQAGGYGARATRDGIDAIQPHMQNTENAPIEESEANYPVRFMRYELIPDSEGAGRFRGGLGLRRDYCPEGAVVFSVLSERAKFPPWGLAGGGPARPARYIRNPDGEARAYPSKFSVQLQAGEVMSIQMAGGGGYGPPWEREPWRVLEDVLAEKVSVQRAREAYGVVIDPKSGRVDEEATAAARQRMRRQAQKQG